MNGSSLTPFAWVFMITSMLSVTTLFVYCYKRILFDDKEGPAEELRPPGDAPVSGA